MVKRRSESNNLFPANPEQLGDFSRGMNETVQVKIPEDLLESMGESGTVTYIPILFKMLAYLYILVLYFVTCKLFSFCRGLYL